MYFYDVYMSLGNACRPAYHLSRHELRNEAYPLDWQMAYSLDTVIHLFQTKFADFFVEIKEDNVEWNGTHRWVKDVRNGIVSIHHFSRDMEIDEAQKVFLEQMRRRFNRLDERLKEARRVLLICNRGESVEKLQSFLNEFSALYPHLEIKLMNMRNNEDMDLDSYNMKRYVLSDHLSIEEYSFNDSFNGYTREKAEWHGNLEMWGIILNSYYNQYRLERYRFIQKFKEENKALVIYGAGKRCKNLLYEFDVFGIPIKGIAVTDTDRNPQFIGKYCVGSIEKYDKNDTIVISLKDRQEAEKIKNALVSKEYQNLYFVNQKLHLEKAL